MRHRQNARTRDEDVKVYVTILAATTMAMLAGSASASPPRTLCNSVPKAQYTYGPGAARLKNDLWVALGFERDGAWVSSGWWHLRPGQCQKLDNFPTPDKHVYLSVFEHNPATGKSYSWPGGFVFCTRDESYEEHPASQCNGGFEKTEFFNMIRGSDDQSRKSRSFFNRQGFLKLHFFRQEN